MLSMPRIPVHGEAIHFDGKRWIVEIVEYDYEGWPGYPPKVKALCRDWGAEAEENAT